MGICYLFFWNRIPKLLSRLYLLMNPFYKLFFMNSVIIYTIFLSLKMCIDIFDSCVFVSTFHAWIQETKRALDPLKLRLQRFFSHQLVLGIYLSTSEKTASDLNPWPLPHPSKSTFFHVPSQQTKLPWMIHYILFNLMLSKTTHLAILSVKYFRTKKSNCEVQTLEIL